MQTTGIIRKVDDLGRIVLPVEVRRAMGIQVGTELEILVENRRIVLEKMDNCCICVAAASKCFSRTEKVPDRREIWSKRAGHPQKAGVRSFLLKCIQICRDAS